MPRTIQYEGRQIQVPDDFTDQDVQAVLMGGDSAPAASAAPPIPAPNAGTTEFPQENTPGHYLKLGLQAAGRGIADIKDVANLANPLTYPFTAAEAIGFKGLPSVGQSGDDLAASAENVATSAGYEPAIPQSFPQKAASSAIRFGTQALAGGLGLARAAAARAPAIAREGAKAAFGDTFLAPYLTNPTKAVIGDTIAGGGAGAAVTAPQELIPENVRAAGGGTVGAGADLLAMLAGGTTAGGLYGLATGAPTKISEIFTNSRPARDIALDPETKRPTTNKEADQAARFIQGQAIDPAMAAERIAAETAAARAAGTPVPTTGLISGDTGLEAVERGQRRTLSTPSMFKEPSTAPEVKSKYSFGERDTALRDQAVTDVNSIRPAGTTPDDLLAPRAEAERIAAERVGSAEALGGQRVAETEAAGRQRVADAEAAARQRVAEAEQPVAQTRQEVAAAEAAARDQAAGLAPQRSETVRANASGRVHEAVTGPYREARAAKNEAFNTLDPNREHMVDATGVVEAARRVREGVNQLGPAQQLPGEFVQRLEQLAPDAGGTGQAALGDLVDVRKYLSTAHENARRSGNFALADNIADLRRTINATIEREPGAAAANEQYRGFADTYRPQPTDEMAKFTREVDRGREPPPSKTAERFLSGPEKTAALRRVLDNSPTRAEGERAVRDYQLGEAASVGLNRNDTVNWRALAKWRDNNAEALRTFPNPEVDRLIATARSGEQLSNQAIARLRDAEARLAQTQQETTRALRTTEREADRGVRTAEQVTQRNVRATEQGIDNSALSALIGRAPDVAAREVFGRRDPVGAMREIKGLLRGNQQAERGWKAAIADHFSSKVSNTNPANVTEGVQDIGFAKLVKEFNRNEKALVEVFSPEEMNALRRAHKQLEPLTKRQGQATVGSPTAENTELAWRPVELALKAWYGILKGGGVFRTVKLGAKSLAGDTPQQVERLLGRFAFDPDLAQHLLTRKVSDVGTPAWNAKLQKLLRYGQAARDVTQENQ